MDLVQKKCFQTINGHFPDTVLVQRGLELVGHIKAPEVGNFKLQMLQTAKNENLFSPQANPYAHEKVLKIVEHQISELMEKEAKQVPKTSFVSDVGVSTASLPANDGTEFGLPTQHVSPQILPSLRRQSSSDRLREQQGDLFVGLDPDVQIRECQELLASLQAPEEALGLGMPSLVQSTAQREILSDQNSGPAWDLSTFDELQEIMEASKSTPAQLKKQGSQILLESGNFSLFLPRLPFGSSPAHFLLLFCSTTFAAQTIRRNKVKFTEV